MEKELEIYFDNYNELFNHEGFRQLIHELMQNVEQLSDINSVRDADDLNYRKGQIAAFNLVIGMEGTISASRQQVEAEERGDVYV